MNRKEICTVKLYSSHLNQKLKSKFIILNTPIQMTMESTSIREKILI
jgi:hypothetical protein